MGPSTLAIACVTSMPPKRSPPSRRSMASREPRDAPAGAIARPVAPPASATSASTVGRPRESQTRRPRTATIVVVIAPATRPAATQRAAMVASARPE